MTAFRHLDFMPGVVWSLFFLFQCSTQTSDWFPCPASPQLVPPDPSCSFPFQSLTSTTPTPSLLCTKSSHQASFCPSWFLICTALLSCPTLGKHDILSIPMCPFLLTSRPGLHSLLISVVQSSLQASPGAPVQARSPELISHIEQTWCQANWNSCDYVSMALSPS